MSSSKNVNMPEMLANQLSAFTWDSDCNRWRNNGRFTSNNTIIQTLDDNKEKDIMDKYSDTGYDEIEEEVLPESIPVTNLDWNFDTFNLNDYYGKEVIIEGMVRYSVYSFISLKPNGKGKMVEVCREWYVPVIEMDNGINIMAKSTKTYAKKGEMGKFRGILTCDSNNGWYLSQPKLLKTWDKTNQSDEEFMAEIWKQYATTFSSEGEEIPLFATWRAENAFGGSRGDNWFAGDANFQAQQRMETNLAFFDVYPKTIKQVRSFVESCGKAETWILRTEDGRNAKYEEAKEIANVVVKYVNEMYAMEECLKMDEEALWAMVPVQLWDRVSSQWSKRMEKLETRIRNINVGLEKAESFGSTKYEKIVLEAMKPCNYEGDFFEAVKDRVQKIMVDNYGVGTRIHVAMWIGLNAAVEYGFVKHSNNRKEELAKFLSWLWQPEGAWMAAFNAAMAQGDLAYQTYLSNSQGVDDNRLDDGKTLDSVKWAEEYCNMVWNRRE